MTTPTITLPVDPRAIEHISGWRPTLQLGGPRNELTITLYAVMAPRFGETKSPAVITIPVNDVNQVYISIKDPEAKRGLNDKEHKLLQLTLDKLSSINAKHMLGVDAIMLGHAEANLKKILNER